MYKRILAVILSFFILFSDMSCFWVNAEEIQTTEVDGQTDAEHAKLEEGLKEGGTEENASKPETQAGDGDEAGQERKEASIEDEVDDSAEKAEPEEEDARQSETEVGKEDDREESVSDNSVEQEEKGDGDTEAPIETENLAENLQCNAALYSRRKKHFIFDSINIITALSFR